MKRLMTLVVLLSAAFLVQAQEDARISKESADLSTVELLKLPPQDNKALHDAEMARRGPGTAPRFAETIEVEVDAHEDGTWEYLPDGNALWRLRIQSEGAKSLNLGFTEYYMPDRGSLILYSPDYERVMGPFTPADNEVHDQLWTPVLDGDELVIEVKLPAEEVENLHLKLSYVNHDFIGFGNMSILSGSCNLDVICGEDDGWSIVDDYRDIIQSVAVISTGGNTFCTGFLVNNARQDCAPLFMTAFHCGINSNSAPSLVTYWNYENSFCRQPSTPQSGAPGDGLLNDFNTGATYLSGYQPSDFVLVEMDDPISETAEAFFAGWNAESVTPDNAIAVHHPSTDEKRISFEEDPCIQSDYFGNFPNPNGTHIRVEDWDIGTTEPGSSGSPLFDQNKRVVGQLHGGTAACGNDEPDWYGAVSVSWEGGGTPNTRLKDWLDPDNTGVLTLDGRSQEQCSFFVEAAPAEQSICLPGDVEYMIVVSENFADSVDLTLLDVPAGATASFGINPVGPGGTTTLTLSDLDGLAAGTYVLTLEGTDGTEMNSSELVLYLYDEPPAQPQLMEPADLSEDLNTTIDFVWENLAFASTYSLQVAEDLDFSALVLDDSGLMGVEAMVQGLQPNSTYYWRMKAENLCGESDWSPAFTFSTGNITCNLRESANVPVAIPTSGGVTVSSELFMGTPGQISDVNVINLNGKHTWVSDLTVRLISPEGTQVTLFDDVCDDLDDFSVSFDDDAAAFPPCPITDGGTYKPQGLLAVFNGEDPYGVWTLEITDNLNQDGGSLDGWGLEICLIPEAALSSAAGQQVLCDDETSVFELQVSAGFDGPVDLSVDGNPMGSSVAFSSNPAQPGEVVEVTIADMEGIYGNFLLVFSGTDGDNADTFELPMEINTSPGLPELGQPADGAINVAAPITFGWNPSVPSADEYLLEVATDETFMDVVLSETLTQNFFIETQSFAPETFFFWRVTAVNDCGTVVSPPRVFGSEGTSAVDEPAFQGWSVSPNPSSGQFQVVLSQPVQEDLRAEVYLVNGQRIYTQFANSGLQQFDLDLSAFPAGVYVLKMRTSKRVYAKRLVLQR